MLSIQTPSYAGMERIGVPTRSSIMATSRDERSQRERQEKIVAKESSSSSSSRLLKNLDDISSQNQKCCFMASNNVGYLTEELKKNENIHDKNIKKNNHRRLCPHHVPLPDGEWGIDRHLQIRSPSQQSEIPRTYTIAPPNKSVNDVPGNNRVHNTSTTKMLFHIGNGKGINATSSSMNKSEKSKHKILSFFFKPTLTKSHEPNNSHAENSTLRQTTIHCSYSHASNNNFLNNYLPSTDVSQISPTFTNNPPLEGRINGYTPCIIDSAKSTHILNSFTSDLSPSTSQLSVVAASCVNHVKVDSLSLLDDDSYNREESSNRNIHLLEDNRAFVLNSECSTRNNRSSLI